MCIIWQKRLLHWPRLLSFPFRWFYYLRSWISLRKTAKKKDGIISIIRPSKIVFSRIYARWDFLCRELGFASVLSFPAYARDETSAFLIIPKSDLSFPAYAQDEIFHPQRPLLFFISRIRAGWNRSEMLSDWSFFLSFPAYARDETTRNLDQRDIIYSFISRIRAGWNGRRVIVA